MKKIMKYKEEVAGFFLLGIIVAIGILFLVGLSGCGQAEQSAAATPDPTASAAPSTPEVSPNAFDFEEVGDVIPGMPVHIERLPDGNWLVAESTGNVFLLDEDFKIISSSKIAISAAQGGSLTTAIQDPDYSSNHYIYIYYTMPEDSAPPCDTVLCNAVARYDFDETAADPLSNPLQLAFFPSPDQGAQHNGGGMTFGPDDELYIGVGDEQFWQSAEDLFSHDLAQKPDSNSGKIFRYNLQNMTLEKIAMGVRNPFTMISTPEGAVFGDVGWETAEEADIVPWSAQGLNLNYGWPWLEGGGFNQTLWPTFLEPLQSFRHCDDKLKNQDSVKIEDGDKCGPEIITVDGYYPPRTGGQADPYAGALDGSIVYAEPYYGWVRAFNNEGGVASNDRQISHLSGLSSLAVGPDGYFYGTSIFLGMESGGSKIQRLVAHKAAQ